MLLTTDFEKACVETKYGYVHKKSNIKFYDTGAGFSCPFHANFDAKIISISYGDLDDALIVENWQACKIARKIGGEAKNLMDAKPVKEEGAEKMRELLMMNVGFGDCFILSEENDGMLIDFGSIQSIHTRLVSDVESQILNKNIRRCLLTHFHSDHYKGINELANLPSMKNRFSEIILPNIYFNQAAFRIQLFRLIALSKYGGAWLDAYNYVSSKVRFQQLLVAGGHFHYVAESAQFRIGKTEYTVLAPSRTDLIKLGEMELLQYVDEWLNGRDDKAQDEIRQLYREIIQATFQTMKFDDAREFTAEKFVERKDWDIDLESLLQKIEQFSELKLSIPIDKQKKLDGLQRSFSYDWNRLSIVFKANDDSLLMTGDMKKRVWDGVVRHYCRNHIAVFKVPHHGTKDYFCWDFPQDSQYLISNGQCKGWDISALYPLYYCSSKFSCTNSSECEFDMGTHTKCSGALDCGCLMGSGGITVRY